MSSGFSSFLEAPLRPFNDTWQPTAAPDQPAAADTNAAAAPPVANATQVPLPPPPFEALRAIRQYFLKGGHYAYEGRAGSGAYSSVYTLRQVGQETSNSGRRVAAKLIQRFRDPRFADDTPVEEVEALESLAAAAHVVRVLDSQMFGGADLYGVRQWVLLEYLEGGTFRDFVARVRRRGKVLPNRMLWSIFRCFIRVSIAMAYSEQMKNGPVRLETVMDGPHPQSALYNTDMHTANLMFGSFEENESETEHHLSPILKMIDLGRMERVDTSSDDDWNRTSENLVSLVSNAFAILAMISQSPGARPLDPELRNLVAICTRQEGTFRGKGWSFKDLDERVQRGFEQGPGYYTDNLGIEDGTEDDDAIVAVVRELFLDAEPSQGAPTAGAALDVPPDPLFHPNDSDLPI